MFPVSKHQQSRCSNVSDLRGCGMLYHRNSYEHVEIPLHVIPTLHSTYSAMTTSALVHLIEILHEEQEQTYRATLKYVATNNASYNVTIIRHNSDDMVVLHNSAGSYTSRDIV